MHFELSRRQFLLGSSVTLASSTLSMSAIAVDLKQPGIAAGPSWDAIDRFVASYMDEMNAPGMILAVSSRDGLLRSSRHGFSDRAARQPIGPAELFQIGSITKSFVAIALLQLREEGKLDLDRPVLEYLPDLRLDTPFGPITAHHLLTHTAGIPNTLSLYTSDSTARHRAQYAPGERFFYSNLGYDMLGALLRALDGRELAESLRQRIFEPLGMTQTDATLGGETRARTAMSYVPYLHDRPYRRKDRLTEAPEILFSSAAGSIASNGDDMARYLTMLANRGALPRGRLLSEESFKRLVRPWAMAKDFGPNTGYGYGLMIEQTDGRTVLRHTGGMVSFASAMRVDLESGFGAFASINAMQEYRPNDVVKWAVEVMRSTAQRKPLSTPPTLDAATKIPNPADYAGTYEATNGRTLEFIADSDRLYLLHAGTRVPVEQLSVPGLSAVHPEFERFVLTFTRKSGGETGPYDEVFYGGDSYARRVQEPVAGQFAIPADWSAYVGHYRNENPWLGSVRIVTRKDRLWGIAAQGYEFPFEPIDERTFRLVDNPNSTDWIQFRDVTGGQATHMSLSGDLFWRVAVP